MRTTAIPLDHLIAELAAFPLAAEAALMAATTTLAPACGGNALDESAGGATGALWRAAEGNLLHGAPGLRVDELVTLRDWLWFGSADEATAASPVPLDRYLSRLAGLFLRRDGGCARACLPGDDSTLPAGLPGLAPAVRGRKLWRWLSFALPPDLLLAAIDDGPQPQDADAPTEVELMSPALERHLADCDFAETHLHVNAAVPFPLLWVATLHALAADQLPDFRSPGAELEEGRKLAPWLVRAALVRQALARFLSDPSRGSFADALGATPSGEGGIALRCAARDLCAGGLSSSVSTAEFAGEYRRAADLYPLQSLLNWEEGKDDLRAILHADPIARYVGVGTSSPEQRLVRRALSYLAQGAAAAGTPDSCFSACFWQVVRLRALLYRHVVQRPMTPGLQWFIRFFGRIKPTRGSLTMGTRVRLAAERSGCGKGLRSLELRTAPEAEWRKGFKFVEQLEQVGRVITHSGVSEIGCVLHLQKERGGGADKGTPRAHGAGSTGDPKADSWGFRYGSYYATRRREALGLVSLFEHQPRVLRLIRGLDICTDELAVPAWVLAPLLRWIRDAGALASRALAGVGEEVPPLRMTAHAGEDFVHLLGGLRRIDEALRYLGLGEADRLGHGSALGVDPCAWAKRTGRVRMTRWERLQDLIWEWTCYARGWVTAEPHRIPTLEREVARLSRAIVDQVWTPVDAEQLIEDLHNEAYLGACGFPAGVRRSGSRLDEQRRKRVEALLTSSAVFRRGQCSEWVDVEHEGESVAACQAMMRTRLGARGITVEVNPSSNLLIGHFGELKQHPMWRLRPPSGAGAAPPVSVCLGSDNPLTFATTLPAEYQLVMDALLEAGLADAEAQTWLEGTRVAGLDARFTIPHRAALPALADPFPSALWLKEAWARLRPPP